MSNPITVTVNEASVITGTTITVSQANIVAGGSVAVTVSNSPIASGAGKTVVSSGGIADLTQTQQDAIGEGTVVVTTDGYRYIYSGGGSKTNPASYVILADITPDWSTLSGKPSTFTPSSHASAHGSAGADPVTLAISQVTGLQTALNGKAATGHTHTVADVSYLQTYLDGRVSSAVPFTANHTAARGSNYVIGDLVHHEGNIYRAIANNDGIVPQSGAGWESYWTLVGSGYRHNIDIKDIANYWIPPESATEGYVLTYQSGSWVAAAAPAELPAGTTGQVLTHDGTAWTAAAGYSLPTATDTVLGGVKIGSGVTITDGVISVSTAYAASSHTHGWSDITSGVPTTLSGYGITDAVDTSDSRLADARTPTAHSATHATGGSDAITAADIGAAESAHTHAARDIPTGTLAIDRIPTGTTASEVCIGNDSRLSDARTPTAHKTSHATGGSDALTAADIGAAASSHTHAAGDITSGTVATARLGSGTAGAYTWLAGDSAWKSFAFIPGYSGFADADDWASRVTTNGGSVSTSTMTAVYQFCLAIAAAGIRDRFYRLNLFCGTGLNAALVPLYRGPTRTGTQYGNTTDTNNGPFVSGDYAETGTNGGLKGNGSTKYLATGLTHLDLGTALAHVCGSFTQTDSDYFGGIVATWSGGTGALGYRNYISIENTGGGRKARIGVHSTMDQPTTTFTAGQKVIAIGSRTGTSSLQMYYDQTQVFNQPYNLSYSASDPGYGAYVLAINDAGTALRPTFAYVRSYSLGLALSEAQINPYVAAIRNFEDAMGRR